MRHASYVRQNVGGKTAVVAFPGLRLAIGTGKVDCGIILGFGWLCVCVCKIEEGNLRNFLLVYAASRIYTGYYWLLQIRPRHCLLKQKNKR